MKLNRRYGLLMVALASIGAGAAVTALAQTSPSAASSSSAAPAGRGHWHGAGRGLAGTLLRATRQLNLTAEQQSQIKTVLSTARAQARANASAAGSVDIAVLGNPADPNYATALETMKTNAANRIQLEAEVQSQIYNVLTSEQRAQLPTVLASIKAKMAQRRAAWQQRAAGQSN